MIPITARIANTSRHEPTPIIENPQGSRPRGNNPMATRRQPYAPSFITTPASSIDAAVGAAAWPVGAQVWNGHMPASTANPTNTSGKNTIWKCVEKCVPASASKLMLCPPEATHAATIPASTSALPANEYSASFIAAYSRCDPAFSPVASCGTDPQ